MNYIFSRNQFFLPRVTIYTVLISFILAYQCDECEESNVMRFYFLVKFACLATVHLRVENVFLCFFIIFIMYDDSFFLREFFNNGNIGPKNKCFPSIRFHDSPHSSPKCDDTFSLDSKFNRSVLMNSFRRNSCIYKILNKLELILLTMNWENFVLLNRNKLCSIRQRTWRFPLHFF